MRQLLAREAAGNTGTVNNPAKAKVGVAVVPLRLGRTTENVNPLCSTRRSLLSKKGGAPSTPTIPAQQEADEFGKRNCVK